MIQTEGTGLPKIGICTIDPENLHKEENVQKSAAPAIEVVPYRWVILAMMVACFLFTFIVRFTWPPLIHVVVPALNMKMA